MKYIVFGGTFDPWTPAHEEIVRRLLADYPDHQIVVVPTTVSWHRKGKAPLFAPHERLAIIEHRLRVNAWDRAGESRKAVWIDDTEYLMSRAYPGVRRGFVDTLQGLVAGWLEHDLTAPSPEIRFVVGADEWRLFPEWKDSAEILKIAKPIVVLRGGETLPTDVDILNLDAQFAGISASAIRARYGAEHPTWKRYCADRGVWTADVVPEFLLLRTPIFDVLSVPSGDPEFRPIRVHAPDWVCVLVESGETFKCVRQKRWGTGREYDEFVTGVVDDGEKPVEAAQRELREELGLDVPNLSDFTLIGSQPTNPGFIDNHMHYFHVDLAKAGVVRSVPPKPDVHERLTPVDISTGDAVYNTAERPALMLAGLALLAVHLDRKEQKK